MPPSSWKKYKLKNLAATITRGISPTYSQQGIYVLNQKCIRNGKISYTHARFHYNTRKKVNDQKYLQQSDTLVCSTGVGTLGRVGRFTETIPNISTVDSHVTIVRPNQKIFPLFLSYAMIDKQPEIELLAEGTTGQTELSRTKLGELEISLPPMEEQKRIAGVLGAFDDKIELLQKQNKTLENMAKALFKSWFVDFDVVHAKQQGQPKAAVMQQYHLTEELYNLFPSSFEPSALGPIPTGWQVKTLGQVSLCFDSKRVPLSNRDRASRRGVYPYFGATSVMDYINDFLFDDIYLLLGEDGSVIKNDGTPFLQYVFGKIWVNNHAHVLQGKEPITTEFLYLFLSDFQIQPYVTGAVQAKLNQKNMNSIPMVIPDKNILNYFNIYAKRLFNKIIHNHKQIQTLTEMRDALLPRLISGKIRV